MEGDWSDKIDHVIVYRMGGHMRRLLGLTVSVVMLGVLLLGLQQPVALMAEGTAEPTAEATAALPTDLVGKIAFVSETSTDTQLYIMNADGSDLHAVMKSDRIPWSPALSPDGSQLAFAAKVNERYQIFVINTDGTDEKQITFNISGQTGVSGINWSRDGKRIVYTLKIWDSPNFQSYDLYSMNADGTDQKKLTPQPMESLLSPHWSPDGKQIVFNARGNSPNTPETPVAPDTRTHVYVINADGSNLHPLTQDDYNQLFPAWSPDGQSIVFLSGGPGGLYRIDPDGSNQTLIINTLFSQATWSPDG